MTSAQISSAVRETLQEGLAPTLKIGGSIREILIEGLTATQMRVGGEARESLTQPFVGSMHVGGGAREVLASGSSATRMEVGGAAREVLVKTGGPPPPPPPPPPTPFTCWAVPPVQGTSPLSVTIPAYPYWQYNDDDSVSAFFTAYNLLTQQYIIAFNTLNLPVYPLLSGNLLDWVAAGLYGFPTRPTLTTGTLPVFGAYNTQTYNGNNSVYNATHRSGTLVYMPVSDDVFKRIITWAFYKGDGKVFSIRWLKRRIARFLFAAPGCLNPNIDQTYQISITFGAGNIVYINLIEALYKFEATAIYDQFTYGSQPYVGKAVKVAQYPQIALAQVFKDCVDGGFLELPFQYQWIVQIVG
jgi:hypothetical protein